MGLDIVADEQACGDDLQSATPDIVERGLDKALADAPPLERLRHLGVVESALVAVRAVAGDCRMAVDLQLVPTLFAIVVNLARSHEELSFFEASATRPAPI